MNPLKLTALEKGKTAIIKGITKECDTVSRQRFLDLGFVNGAKIAIENISPLGDPIAYSIHQTQICLRKIDADKIIIAILSPETSK